jgi:hypothetical protein
MTDIEKALNNADEFLKEDGGLSPDDSALGFKANENAEELTDDDKADALQVVLKAGCLYRINSRCWSGVTSKVPEEQIKAPKEILTGLKNLIDDLFGGGIGYSPDSGLQPLVAEHFRLRIQRLYDAIAGTDQ